MSTEAQAQTPQAESTPTPSARRTGWRIAFSLRTLLLLTLLFASAGSLWWRWKPWLSLAVLRHEKQPTGIAISPDRSKFLVSRSPTWPNVEDESAYNAIEYDSQTLEQVLTIPIAPDNQPYVYFSANGALILQYRFSSVSCVQVYSTSTAKEFDIGLGKDQFIRDFKTDASGKVAVVTPAQNISDAAPMTLPYKNLPIALIDLSTKKTLCELKSDGVELEDFSFSADGKWISATINQLTNTHSGVHIFDSTEGNIAFSSDQFSKAFFLDRSSQILLTSETSSVLMEWPSKKGLLRVNGEVKRPLLDNESVAIVARRIAPRSFDYEFSLQSLKDSDTAVALANMNASFTPRAASPTIVYGLRSESLFSPNSYSIIGWDRKSGEYLFKAVGGESISSDFRVMAGKRNENILLFNAQTGDGLCEISGHEAQVEDVAFLDNKTLISSAWDGTVRIWRNHRPEQWWGIAWLPESWLTLLFSLALIWSIRRDIRTNWYASKASFANNA